MMLMLQGLTNRTCGFYMTNKTIIARWLLVLLMLVVLLTGINIWLPSQFSGERTSADQFQTTPKKGNQLPSQTENLTVEKLNNQVQVKQLRQALLNGELLPNDQAISADDVDQKIALLEQELQQLSTTN